MENKIPDILLENFTTEEIESLLDKDYDLILKCDLLISRLFAVYKLDKEGNPYISHLYRVASRQVNTKAKAAALLHNIIRFGVSENILKAMHIDDDVIDIIKLNTKPENITYEQMISNIIKSGNLDAMNVAYADILDEIDPESLKVLDEDKQQELIRRYEEPLIRLRRAFKIE